MLVTSSIVGIFFCYLAIKLSPKGIIKIQTGFVKNQFKFSLPLGMSQFISITSTEIDKMFISIFFTIKEFATYSVGAVELPITNLIVPSIRAVLLPEFSTWFKDGNISKVLETWRESRRKLAIITFPIIFFFFFVSHEFITFLYTDNYALSVPIFQIYLIMPFLLNFESSVILHSKGKTKLLLYVTLINFTTNILLNYVLINFIGTLGPCIATVLASSVANTIAIIWVAQTLKTTPVSLFPISDYARIVISCLFSGLILFCFKYFFYIEEKILFLCIAGTLYFTTLIFFYVMIVLQREDFESLRKYFVK